MGKKTFYRLILQKNGYLHFLVFYARKKTSCGYWISESESYDLCLRWIPAKSKKRFAYPSKEEAVKNYIIRTLSCIEHSERILKNSKSGIYQLLNSEFCTNEAKKIAAYNEDIYQWDFENPGSKCLSKYIPKEIDKSW